MGLGGLVSFGYSKEVPKNLCDTNFVYYLIRKSFQIDEDWHLFIVIAFLVGKLFNIKRTYAPQHHAKSQNMKYLFKY